MPMYGKLTTVAAVAALTLGLAACGGGGSDQISNVVDEEPTMDDSTMDDSTTDDTADDDSMKDDDMDTVMSDEEKTGRASGVATALSRNAVTSTDGAPTARILRGLSGAPSITLKGWTGSASDPGATGWAGMMFEGAGLTTEGQSMAVYTNIEAAKAMSVTATNAATVLASGATYVAGVANDDPATPLDETAVHFTLLGALPAAAAAQLDSGRFPAKGDKTVTYGTAAADTHKRSFTGTFQGAQGTYDCNPAGGVCSVAAPDPNAPATATYTLTGTWTFTPSQGQKVTVSDSAHVSFGWWIESPSKADSGGAYIYDVEVFQRGTTGAANAILPNAAGLSGTATYAGPAAGVYATKGESATHGTFTADAELVATFGATAAGVEGEIGNFRGGDGMGDWSIKLMPVDLVTNALANATDSFSGTTSGTGKGTWTGTFYEGTTAPDTAPKAIGGTFDAHSDAVSIAGAFGADKQ